MFLHKFYKFLIHFYIICILSEKKRHYVLIYLVLKKGWAFFMYFLELLPFQVSNLNQVFRSVTFYPVAPDPLDANPPKNVEKFINKESDNRITKIRNTWCQNCAKEKRFFFGNLTDPQHCHEHVWYITLKSNGLGNYMTLIALL